MDKKEMEALVRGEHGKPFSRLGPHATQSGGEDLWIVRTLAPDCERVDVTVDRKTLRMRRLHPRGLYEASFRRGTESLPRYRFRLHRSGNQVEERIDPYRFRELLSDYDLYLLGEGTHFRSYEKLGAHIETRDETRGVRFAAWAPNARAVSVTGDFNDWNHCSHPMELHPDTGVWQLFVPGVSSGGHYKFVVRFRNGHFMEKIDPYAFQFEEPPRTAAVVFDYGQYRWGDQHWMKTRGGHNALGAPISIYEVHLGSWRRVPEEGNRPLTYRELAEQLIPYVKEMGFTHIELLPITEHPFSGSWGYQSTGYYAPTRRFGPPDDFRYFVDRCHQSGLGVLLDWVPGHFPRDLHALAYFDGTHLYEHADPRQGAHPDWGTLIFNFGRNEVSNFLLSSALFWLDEYHLDGLRVDAVASMLYLDYSRQEGEWIPNRYGGRESLEAIAFLKKFNELVYEHHPDVLTVAEESTAWPSVSRPTYLGGLGFGMKWNMGWMHDSLAYICEDPVHRKYHHNKLTFSMLYAFSENFILPLSHDEVVHGKRSLLDKQPGDLWQKFANLRLFFAYMFGHPGKKLLFMGGEFGQWNEWKSEESLDWHLLQWDSHRQLQQYVRELNRLYTSEPAFFEVDFHWDGFEWIDLRDQDHSILSFLRRSKKTRDFLIFVYNFTPVSREGYRIGVPQPGLYKEILNSDASIWGGSNVGNLGGVEADPVPVHGRSYSLELTLPPLAALILKPASDSVEG